MALILSGDTGPSFVQAAAQPAGSVIQVVNGTASDYSGTTSATWQTVQTVSITPQFSNSKIFVIYTGMWFPYDPSYTTNNQIGMQGVLIRGTSVSSYEAVLQGSNYFELQAPNTALYTYYSNQTYMGYDSPATTSSKTYTMQISGWPGNNASVQLRTANSNMVAMEIKV